MKNIRAFYGFLSLLFLFLGMTIYLLFRNLNGTILFSLILKYKFIKTILVPLKPSVFANILRYNIPDMFWFLSGILFFRFIWFFNINIQLVYIFCFYGIAFIIEISQLSEKIPGTFDWMDLLFLGIAAFVEGLLYKNYFPRRFV